VRTTSDGIYRHFGRVMSAAVFTAAIDLAIRNTNGYDVDVNLHLQQLNQSINQSINQSEED